MHNTQGQKPCYYAELMVMTYQISVNRGGDVTMQVNAK